MMKMKTPKLLTFAVLLSCTAFAQAQIFYNNGANVYMNNGSIVQINGDAQNAGAAGNMNNKGDVTITGSITNDATAGGDGIYHVAGDFINNSTFTAGTGTVELNGASQQIAGTQVTTFHDLLLTGTGIKSQAVDARVGNLLALNDRELATDVHTMFVDNTATTAITRTTGFVSSNVGGALARATFTTNTYEFPTGSSLGTPRYRPVNITPAFPFSTTYTVRFVNNDATTDSYDRSNVDSLICETNPNWYHMIDRIIGNTAADLSVYFDAADGSWSGIGNWSTTASEWQSTGTASVAAGYVTINDWNDFSFDPYILTNRKANAAITAVPPMCANSAALNLTAAETGGTWTGTGITDGTAGTFNPATAGAGTYTITYTISGACGDTAQSQITVNSVAVLSAVTTDESCVNKGDGSIDLTVTSGTSPYSYLWDNSATTEDLSNLGPGNYVVVVTDANNCAATQSYDILAGTGECVPESFYIPNIFSPNGDNNNDVFYVRGYGIKTLHLEIYDRWGEKVFETDDPNIGWDGKYKDKDMSSAVFVYKVSAEMNSGTQYNEKGNITLVR